MVLGENDIEFCLQFISFIEWNVEHSLIINFNEFWDSFVIILKILAKYWIIFLTPP